MSSTTADVTIVREYFAALRRVRVMKCGELVELLDSGRGRLAGRFGYVPPPQKHSFRISPGQGVQLWVRVRPPHDLYCPREACTDTMVHAVLLYRGLDGKYCFFDSNFAIAPTPEVEAAVARSGMGPVHYRLQRPGIQGVGVATCQYYCLAFMSFIVQHPHLPTRRLIGKFVKAMRQQRDVKAVRLSRELFDEAGIVRDFESTGAPVHGHYQPTTIRKRKRDGSWPMKKQRIVDSYTQNTQEQIKSLMTPAYGHCQPTSVGRRSRSWMRHMKRLRMVDSYLKTKEQDTSMLNTGSTPWLAQKEAGSHGLFPRIHCDNSSRSNSYGSTSTNANVSRAAPMAITSCLRHNITTGSVKTRPFFRVNTTHRQSCK